MNILRTWEDLARALDSPLEPTLKLCLQGHRDRLSEWQGDYELNELAVFVIVQAGDTLEQAEAAFGRLLVRDGHLALLPEFVEFNEGFAQAVAVLSDDGFGVVLIAEAGPAADPRLMQAFRNAFTDNDAASSR